MQILNQQGYYSTEEGAKSGTRRGEGRNASEYYIMIVPQQTNIHARLSANNHSFDSE